MNLAPDTVSDASTNSQVGDNFMALFLVFAAFALFATLNIVGRTLGSRYPSKLLESIVTAAVFVGVIGILVMLLFGTLPDLSPTASACILAATGLALGFNDGSSRTIARQGLQRERSEKAARLEEQLSKDRAAGKALVVAGTLTELAVVYRNLDQTEKARSSVEEAYEIYRQEGLIGHPLFENSFMPVYKSIVPSDRQQAQ